MLDFRHRIHHSWLPVFEPLRRKYEDIIYRLLEMYPQSHFDGFNYQQRSNGERLFLSPRIEAIIEPFALCDLHRLKVIVICRRPSLFATGIPLTSENIIDKADGDNIYDHTDPHYRIIKQLILASREKGVGNRVDLISMARRGILFINSIWTYSYQADVHTHLWEGFMQKFFFNLNMTMPKIIYIQLCDTTALDLITERNTNEHIHLPIEISDYRLDPKNYYKDLLARNPFIITKNKYQIQF